jgi:hypothetical protein
VRREAGESMKSIEGSSPLLHVSTTSLPALQKHAMGLKAYYDEDFGRAVSLFDEAIAMDSSFVDAYMMVSVSLSQLGAQPSRQVETLVKAYQYRDRLVDAERYNVEASYLSDVKGDVPKAIAAMYNAGAIDPEIVFWGKMASLLNHERRFREAESVSLKGLHWNENPFVYYQLATARFRGQRIEDAKKTVAYAANRFPHAVLFAVQKIELTEATGNYHAADSLAHSLPRGRTGTTPLYYQALGDALVGKTDEARAHFTALLRMQQTAKALDGWMRTSLQLARLDLDLLSDTTRALGAIENIIASPQWKQMDVRERPYLRLASLFLRAGKPARAAQLLDDYERAVPPDFRAREQWLRRRVIAMLRLTRGDKSAIDELVSVADTDPSTMASLADVVWGYRVIGNAESVSKAAKTYLAEQTSQRLDEDAFNLASMMQLAGESEKRAKLWRSADPELRQRVH